MNELDFKLLKSISLPSYDNGSYFTEKARLNAIKSIAKETAYRELVEEDLFLLFSKRPIDELGEHIVVLSTHTDAVANITRFFAEKKDSGTLHGTFDNTITNTAALSLMIDGTLRDNVLIAFTGDEENESRGAKALGNYLKAKGKSPFVIVLDVTNVGYGKVSFTVENKLYHSVESHNAIRSALADIALPYRFVAYNPNDIPEYVKLGYVERNSDGGIYEALCDESWEYGDCNIECFSLCIPVNGEMHDNSGLDLRLQDFQIYKNAILVFSNQLSLL